MAAFFIETTTPLSTGSIFTGSTHNVGNNETKFLVMASAEYGTSVPAGEVAFGCDIVIEQSDDGTSWKVAQLGTIPPKPEDFFADTWTLVSTDLAMKKVRVTVRNMAFNTLLSLSVYSRLT